MSSARAWIAARSMRQSLLLAALAGGLGALGLAPFNLPLIALAGFAGLAILVAGADSNRMAALAGLAGGTGYFALALHWIVEPFFVDPWRHGWMAPFALVFLAGGLALFWAAAAWVARRFGPTPGLRLGLFGDSELGGSSELEDFHDGRMPAHPTGRQILTSAFSGSCFS